MKKTIRNRLTAAGLIFGSLTFNNVSATIDQNALFNSLVKEVMSEYFRLPDKSMHEYFTLPKKSNFGYCLTDKEPLEKARKFIEKNEY